MKQRIAAIILIMSLTLTGCSLFDGQYVHITPSEKQSNITSVEAISADNYDQLLAIVLEMAKAGRESGIIYIANYSDTTLAKTMRKVENYLCTKDPIGAYAVEELSYEAGTNSGKTAVAVTMTFRNSPLEIKKMSRVSDPEAAGAAILRALENCDPKIVFMITQYDGTDFAQLVEDLSQTNPQSVMELPRVTEGVYGEGDTRVVELSFAYENSRDNLRQMQSQVRPVFDSAALYVSGDASDNQKYAQLYAFLMERFDYKVQTSITPAYSLLHHGVGDSRAFATVYSAMCRRAGLECRLVTGTRQGEPWVWNMINDGESCYHVDLLRSSAAGRLLELSDSQMDGYVWDYSAYPVCDRIMTYVEPEESKPVLEKEFGQNP